MHFHWVYLNHFGGRLPLFLRAQLFLLELNLLRALGVKFVWTLHNLQAHEAADLRAEHRFVRAMATRMDAILVHSESARLLATEILGDRLATKLTVIAHSNYATKYPVLPTMNESRMDLGLCASAPTLLFFGQIRRYKGVIDLMKAFARSAPPNARLLVHGLVQSGYHDEFFASLVADSRIEVINANIPDAQLVTTIRACDAVVLPYREILTSGAALMAITMGRPCIAPMGGCFEELLGHDAGILYDPNSEHGLDRAIVEACGCRETLARRAEAASRISATYDVNPIAASLRTVYEKVL